MHVVTNKNRKVLSFENYITFVKQLIYSLLLSRKQRARHAILKIEYS